MNLVESVQKSTSREEASETRETHETQHLLREWNKLNLDEHGLLRRKCGPNNQIILPKYLHRLVYKELHEDKGHLCADRVMDLVFARFYCPYMKKDIPQYISTKCRCLNQ